MHTSLRILIAALFMMIGLFVKAQSNVEQWSRFETSLKWASQRNGFTEVRLTATFQSADTAIRVSGFYDGNDQYKIRFMPPRRGRWRYITSSNIPQLNNKSGWFECVAPTGNNHGMVRVSEVYNFRYADGKPYYPFGTTSYSWIHADEALQQITLNSLKQSGFNKLRMCVFPQNHQVLRADPERFPFKIKEVKKDSKGNEIKVWDFDNFDPSFFQHLEQRIDDLNQLGIECDLILFHPYDKGQWGFDVLPMEVNLRYIHYLTARLSSFRNVWWSLANEWDYIQSRKPEEWDRIAKTVVSDDPYRHLCSIHGSSATYTDYWKPEFTHISVQDESPVQSPTSAALLRNIYHKPIICDEVGYEGNLKNRWGNYSAEKMVYLVVNGLIGGTYVTHGECFSTKDDDTLFLAKGGTFKGTSWQRIAFLRKIVEACPHALQLADVGRDNYTATAGNGYWLVSFGKEMNESWTFDLPLKNANYSKPVPGSRYQVEIIDLWDMTITKSPLTFQIVKENDYRVCDKDFKKVLLPYKPYIILRITEIK